MSYLISIVVGFLLALSFFKTLYLLVPFLLTIIFVFIFKNNDYYKNPKFLLGVLTFTLTHSHWYLSLYQWVGTNHAILIWIGISVYFFALWWIFFYLLKYLLRINGGYFFIPLYWILFEWLMSLGTFGYPFMSIYLTQVDAIFRWLTYSIIGSYSVSLIIIFFAIILALVITGQIKERLNIIFFSVFFFIVFAIATNSYLEKESLNGKVLSIAIIQPNIPQINKTNEKMYNEHTKKYFDLINKAIKHHPETNIIILPENIIPALWEEVIKETLPFSTDLGNRLLIFGQPIKRDEKIYNSILFYKQADYIAEYYKRKLVPFGEYLPLLSGWINLNDMIYYSSGNSYNQLINVQSIKFLPLICFESAFSHLLSSKNFFDLGVVVTNDAWFGKYFKELHLRTVRFRATEKSTPFAYSTNNGISAIIDHNGKILKFIPDETTGYIFEKVIVPNKINTIKKIFYFFPIWILVFIILIFIEKKPTQ